MKFGIFCLMITVLSCSLSAQQTNNDIISVFEKYKEMHMRYRQILSTQTTNSNDLKNKLEAVKKEIENYRDTTYAPKLKEAKILICEKSDGALLFEFFRVVAQTANLSDNVSSTFLGEVFICQPDLLIKKYYELDDMIKPIIYRDLEFGFLNITFEQENKVPQYQSLREKLKMLYNAVKKKSE